jgi:hypothetical protein
MQWPPDYIEQVVSERRLLAIKSELETEKGKRRIARQKKDYDEYRAYAQKHGWGEDSVEALFGFLARDLSRPARVRRLYNSIHARITKDLITNKADIQAVMRLAARRNKSIQPHNKEQN